MKNPYEAPRSEIEVPKSVTDRRDFLDSSTDESNGLIKDSRSVYWLAVVCGISGLFLGISGVAIEASDSDLLSYFLKGGFFLAGLLSLIASIDLFRRTNWGLIPGLVMTGVFTVFCSILALVCLLNGEFVGVIFCLLGAISGRMEFLTLRRSAPLFGENRIRHSRLRTELRYRNANKIP